MNGIYEECYCLESIALRVPPAETRLTVYRRFETEYRTAVNWPEPEPAKIHDFGRHFDVFSDILYHEFLVCYIQMFYIILKFTFL